MRTAHITSLVFSEFCGELFPCSPISAVLGRPLYRLARLVPIKGRLFFCGVCDGFRERSSEDKANVLPCTLTVTTNRARPDWVVTKELYE